MLPPGNAEAGPWRSSRTPYVNPVTEAIADPGTRQVVAIFGSQMGKTDGVMLNSIGQKLDDDPAPVLYIGPTKSNIDSVMEPRIDQMLRTSSSLWAKTVKGRKAQKLAKRVAGVSLRMAWAGSATELASQNAHSVYLDELDRMEPIPGEGDPLTIAAARTSSYPDYKIVVTSTPTSGMSLVERHPVTGIDHWKPCDPDDLASPIWSLWQGGTREEWAVPCPHCGAYFVPRFSLLTWPEGCTPARAKREARLACQHCGALCGQEHAHGMNQRGMYLSPGQSVDEAGVKRGELIDAPYRSFWASGLMSPWRGFGDRAQEWLTACAKGDQDAIRAVINTGFGELYQIHGDAPEWTAIRDTCGADYQVGDIPSGAAYLFLSVDVQKDRLVWLVRGWGPQFESWLVDRGELWGDTDQPDVWNRLTALADRDFAGRRIRAVAVDSGYRPDPVYSWVHTRGMNAYATKGRDSSQKLYSATPVEVSRGGRRMWSGLRLWTLDASHFKAWVHDRINWPADQPGAWRLPKEIDENYCRQIVAEQRRRLPSGRVLWVRVNKDNHFLDCEALQVFLAHIEGVRDLRAVTVQGPSASPLPQTGQSNNWLRSRDNRQGWMRRR